MAYVTVRVQCTSIWSDIVIAELFQLGFDTFQELDHGFEGSCAMEVFDEKKVKEAIAQYPEVSFQIKEEEKVNWNKEWEKNYDPIVVGDQIIVRASFHDARPEFPYEIVITPKMSFGTGHHATTYQVLAYQSGLNHTGKKVLDVGTGTGILTIMAYKRGATNLTATDIDDWCIENSRENFLLNEVPEVSLFQGQIQEVSGSGYDIIIANINKNVLLDQLSHYANLLAPDGEIILSGFYEEDIPDLLTLGAALGLQEKVATSRDRWAMLVLCPLADY